MSAPRWVWMVVGASLLVAALARFVALGDVPPGLFRDEAEKGYTALELWQTGRHGEFDAAGNFTVSRAMPLFVEVGGVRTSAIYQYLSAPIVGVFGLSVTTTRLVAATSGWLTVLAAIALAWRIATNDTSRPRWWFVVGTAAFTALSPTHVLFSRWAQQGITVPLWTTLGLLALERAWRGAPARRRAWAAVGGSLMALAAYAYDPARLAVPLIMASAAAWAMAATPRDERRALWINVGVGAAVFAVFYVPLFAWSLSAGGARFARVSVFADRSLGDGLLMAASNYARHFDPRFLFVYGDANPRHDMPWAGVVAWGEAPFFAFGVFALIAAARRRCHRAPQSWLLLGWWLAAPAAAALTNDGVPHALRSILLWPVVALISARGFEALVELGEGRKGQQGQQGHEGRGDEAGRAGAAGNRAAPPCRRVSAWLVPGALGLASAMTLAGVVDGLARVVPREHDAWQAGTVEAIARMRELHPDGPNVLSAEVPYANYYVLFVERTPPAAYHELGPEAARTLIVMPGSKLPAGALLARPNADPFRVAGPTDIVAKDQRQDDGAPPLFTIGAGW